MDNQQRTPLLSWAYFCHGKTMEELKQSLMYTTLELEQTRATVEEELRKREEQLLTLKEVLNKVMRERDEAQEKWQRLMVEKMVFQQQQQQQQQQQGAPASGISSSIEDEQRTNNNSDCEESIVSSPPDPHPQVSESVIEELISADKALPEKGKLLQAVMKAGPLLQTLLLAGPLPQWRHPPPPLQSFDIPPVAIPQLQDNNNNCSTICRKRPFSDASLSPSQTKYQRIVLH